MIELVWTFCVIAIVLSTIKKASEKNKARGQNGQAMQQNWRPQPMQQNRQSQPVQQRGDTAQQRAKGHGGKISQGAYVPSRPVASNQELGANRQRSMAQPDIVERAKANSRRYAAQDETLEEMEADHGHSERVSSAVAGYVEREREEHRRLHEEQKPPVEAESSLGSVEDLIVKGYDGNLSFERDFIGEAQEFLANITIPG